MNLLIVDDEIYVVRVLLKSIDWKKIGIEQTFMAFNTEKAKEIFLENQIDIVVTDIEMPRESGLDFIEWIRSRNEECKIICMTCHSEFKYAHRALRSHVSDYILKPVDFQKLSETIVNIVEELEQEYINKQMRKKGALWNQNQVKLENMFWRDVLSGVIDAKPEALECAAKKMNFNWDHNQQYRLILFSFKQIGKKEPDSDQIKKVVLTLLEDVFLDKRDSFRMGWTDTSHMWIVMCAEKSEEVSIEEVIEVCEQKASINAVAYTDEICYGEELYGCFQKLLALDRENVFLEKGVFSYLHQDQVDVIDSKFYLELRKALKEKDFQKSRLLASEFWNRGYMSSKKLLLNTYAGQYEIYRCIEDNQLTSEQFWNEELFELWTSAEHSVKIYKEWLLAAINQLENLCSVIKTEKKVILQMEEYIKDHIEEKISRDDIARKVGFSTDYISRLFRRETGIALSEYIMKQKIERSKEMIEKDSDSIGNIALSLGYSSFSYFSEIFRRQIGCLPSEYKRVKKTEF